MLSGGIPKIIKPSIPNVVKWLVQTFKDNGKLSDVAIDHGTNIQNFGGKLLIVAEKHTKSLNEKSAQACVDAVGSMKLVLNILRNSLSTYIKNPPIQDNLQHLELAIEGAETHATVNLGMPMSADAAKVTYLAFVNAKNWFDKLVNDIASANEIKNEVAKIITRYVNRATTAVNLGTAANVLGRLSTTKTSYETLKSPTSTAPHSAFYRQQIVPTLSGLHYQPTPKSGHCLYQAVAYYLQIDIYELRAQVATHIERHIDRFQKVITAIDPARDVQSYINAVRNSNEWADNLEIVILMEVLKRPIVVIDPNGQIRNRIDIESEDLDIGQPIFVYYNGHNHYDGLILLEGYNARFILNNLLDSNANDIETEEEDIHDIMLDLHL